MTQNGTYIACQGEKGAFSHLAAKEIFSDRDIRFYATFEQALNAVADGVAEAAVLPVENSAAGRVADLHRLLGDTDLCVTGEHFLRIHHCLVGKPSADLKDIKVVRSHPQALSQCRRFIVERGFETQSAPNTAVAAHEVAQADDPSVGAIASEAAAELHGLKVLCRNVEDSPFNTTRFWVLSRRPAENVAFDNAVTSFVFWVNNQPAVLYKCLGGFATNGVDLLRLESYVDAEHFLMSAGFLVDVAAHRDSESFKNAMAELSFFAERVKILGTYAADPFRAEMKQRQKGEKQA